MKIKTFVIDPKLNYREHYRDHARINKFYEIVNTGVRMQFHTIPDACVDLQFVHENEKITVYACGSFLECLKSPTSNFSWCFGVKFNPGIYPEMLRNSAMDLIGERVVISDLKWLTTLGEKIWRAESFEERVRIFEKEFPFNDQFGGENPIVNQALRRIEKERGCINIAQLADEMQYNQRYMDRIFRECTGMTMKKYSTIIRVQNAIRYLEEGRIDDVYEKLGYYDQAYFIKEFKKYTTMTPRQYSKEVFRDIV